MALHDYLPGVKKPAPRFVNEAGSPVHGMMAEFADPAAVFHGAEKIRDSGYKVWDVYAPFPIHDIEHAMGVKRTKLPLLVAAIAFTGLGLALLMQWWMNYVDYPMIVQGKSLTAWEPFTPVVFELGVLSAAFASLVGMLAMNGLPRHHHPLLANDRFLKVSDDRFVIYIEAEDPNFDPAETRKTLESAGGYEIQLVEDVD